MSITRESPWALLHLGLLVLLALQVALIAARVLSSGADALLGAPLGVMAAGRWYDRARLDALLSEVERAAAASRSQPAR